jgi:Mrp family chromosome partitioning ATPase
MQRLLTELGHRYDVIIVDSAPLGAGVDPLALGALTGNLLLVLRAGTSDRRMTEARLQVIDRLPVHLVGAVVNDVPANGVYRYHSYLYGYGTETEETAAPRLLAAGVSE